MGADHRLCVKITLEDPEGKILPFLEALSEWQKYPQNEDYPPELAEHPAMSFLNRIERPHHFVKQIHSSAGTEHWQFYQFVRETPTRASLSFGSDGKIYTPCVEAYFEMVEPYLVAQNNQLLALFADDDGDCVLPTVFRDGKPVWAEFNFNEGDEIRKDFGLVWPLYDYVECLGDPDDHWLDFEKTLIKWTLAGKKPPVSHHRF